MVIPADGGGGDGFQVVIADLASASTTFETESTTFKGIMPADGPPQPDGGDGAFDGALKAVVQMISACHLQAAGVILNDSQKLKSAHDNYAKTEESLTQLCNQIIAPDKIK